jgi:hypothetical protein
MFRSMKIPVQSCIVLIIIFSSCAASKPKRAFDQYVPPPVPDYSMEKNWAALPWRLDAADSTPAGLKDIQKQSQADVFFVHPTSYLTKSGNDQWNADVNNEQVNQKTDGASILFQASIFNGVGKVYAPRYRQAHLISFFTEDTISANKALDLAYKDVKTAFEYYLKNYNNGRPIILASHSQGSAHMIRILKDFFDNDSLIRKLVVAYVVGIPVPINNYNYLKPCATKYQTSCICSWRSFKIGYEGKFVNFGKPLILTNPLSWTTEPDVYVDKSQNLGSVLDDINEAPTHNQSGAEIHKSILWVDKPKFKGSFLYPFSNFHVGDFNIFYVNVRENAVQRLGAYWKN